MKLSSHLEPTGSKSKHSDQDGLWSFYPLQRFLPENGGQGHPMMTSSMSCALFYCFCCARVSAPHARGCAQRPRECVRSLGAGVADGYEVPPVGARDQTQKE